MTRAEVDARCRTDSELATFVARAGSNTLLRYEDFMSIRAPTLHKLIQAIEASQSCPGMTFRTVTDNGGTKYGPKGKRDIAASYAEDLTARRGFWKEDAVERIKQHLAGTNEPTLYAISPDPNPIVQSLIEEIERTRNT